MTDELLLRTAQVAMTAVHWTPRAVAYAAGRGWIPSAADPGTATSAATGTGTGASSSAAATGTGTAASSSAAASTSVAVPAPTQPGRTTPNATTTTDFPTILLSSLVWAAVAAALIVLVLPDRTREQRDRIRVMGVVGAGFPLLLAAAGLNYQISQDFLGGQTSFEERHAWITTFPVHVDYHLAADGVSLPLLLVSTLVFGAAMLASWRVEQRTKLYVVLLLVLETGVNGSLVAFDYVLLLLFQGMEIVPTFLLLAVWGGEARLRAAWRYAGFALLSLAMLTIAVVIIGLKADQGSFTLLQVSGPADSGVILTGGVATACFWLTFLAFAIRLPVAPLHTWYVDAVAESSAPVGAVVAALAPLVGAYGLMRVVIAGFPNEAHRFSLPLAVVAVVTSSWGAIAALGQDDLRRLIAYTGVGQMGLVLLAVSAQTSVALNGAILLLVAHGLTAAMLVLVAGAVQERARTRSIARLGGLAWRMPKLTGVWMVAGLSAIGAPFLATFAGELQLVAGAYPVHRAVTVLVLVSTMITAGALLRAVQRVFLGPAREAFARVRDATTLELVTLVPLIVVVVAFGVVPGRVIPVINNGVELIASRLVGG